MSEFQRIAFRAIDGPVTDKNLEFMRRQSSRAEVTPWSFDNEYQWGDFRGDAYEMLRRGYDLHVHYANFGTRTVLIRLPNGLPDPEADKPLCVHGNPNVLTRDVGTSRLAQGCTGQLSLVEIERYDGFPPPVKAFDPPPAAA